MWLGFGMLHWLVLGRGAGGGVRRLVSGSEFANRQPITLATPRTNVALHPLQKRLQLDQSSANAVNGTIITKGPAPLAPEPGIAVAPEAFRHQQGNLAEG
jgi:hypothetical protein